MTKQLLPLPLLMPESEPKSAVEMTNTPVPLAQAAIEVQLAVELIMLLEQQQLPPTVILAALEIVQADFRRTLITTHAEIEQR
jgi:hypothetical protein